jgi:glycine/D-amino acid oxidase-like deaminating enzyme
MQAPRRGSYDVVIIGGGIMGASAAFFLTDMPDFAGRVLVIERDPTYATAATHLSNSSMRQQFSTELNVRISQFAADFVKNLSRHLRDDRIPALSISNHGYLYLADTAEFSDVLRANARVQNDAGAATRLLVPEEIAAAYPFYNLDGIRLGSINTVDEGRWDGIAVFDWLRRVARDRGVEYLAAEVTGLAVSADRVTHVTTTAGTIACGQVVNAAGTRAARVAAMAGIPLPVEPRKRYSWIFKAEKPLDRPLPLTIDPTGVHMHERGGGTYECGSAGSPDPAVGCDDFAFDHDLWESHVWPVIATRIPQFEAIRVTHQWTGHYDMNTLDHNAIIGPHDRIGNFMFMNGFSGHGLQQAPAMGRAMAEWLTAGRYRTLDMSPFHFDRIRDNRPLIERAVI